VRKTVIFVTHDIDEAIKMGDRICLLRQGGKLAQFGTPEEILAAPADDFVADFVGADRGLKRLALRQVGDSELQPGDADGLPVVDSTTSLRDALSAMLAAGSNAVAVRGDGDAIEGRLTLAVVSRLLAEDATS